MAREVFRDELAIRCAPIRYSARRLHADRSGDRSGIEARPLHRDLCTEDEAQAAVIEVIAVQVVDRMLLRRRPHEHVDVAIVKRDEHSSPDMRHDVPAEMAARVGEPLRKFAGLGEQQQAHDVVDERGQDDDLGLDRVVGVVGAVIGNTGDAAAVVAVDAIAHGAGNKLEVAGGFGLGNRGHQHRGLRADVTAMGRAEAAVGAARAALVWL